MFPFLPESVIKTVHFKGKFIVMCFVDNEAFTD